MDPDTFARAAERGDIPCEVVRVGNRRFVRIRELAQWLKEPNLDLL
jgi:hypothetical protein